MSAAADTNPLEGRLDSMNVEDGPMSGFSELTLLTSVFAAWEVTPAVKVLLAPVSCEPSDLLLLNSVKILRDLTKWDTSDIKEFLASLHIPATLRFPLEEVVSTILGRPFKFERERLPPPPAAEPAVPKNPASNYHRKLWEVEAGKEAFPVLAQMQDIGSWAIPPALIESHTSKFACEQTLMTCGQSKLLATDVVNWFTARAGNVYPSKEHYDMWEMQLSRLAPLAPRAGKPRSWAVIIKNRSGNGRTKTAQVARALASPRPPRPRPTALRPHMRESPLTFATLTRR
jgi:hypothetical protein